MLNAENFICRLSWSISSHFNTITLGMCVTAQNREKITKMAYFMGSRSLKVSDVEILMKLVTSACYDKQHVCAYL